MGTVDKETARLCFALLDTAQGKGWNFVKAMNQVAEALTAIQQAPEKPPLKEVKAKDA